MDLQEGNGLLSPWPGLLVFIRFQSQLPQRFRAVFQRQAFEVFGEGGAAMVFGHDFSRCFQTKNVFVRSDADGVLSGRGARNGSYFPATGFPFPNLETAAVAYPG